MKITIIGGGSWGTTLAQSLTDNGHLVLIKDVNLDFVNKINNEHRHPFFNQSIPESIKATLDLKLAVDFSDDIVICVPTKFTRSVLEEMNNVLNSKKTFINVSKGIEPKTSKRVSQIVKEVIDEKYINGYVALSGPSHAEELINRKLTCLVSASTSDSLAKHVQLLFSNDEYLRVYTSNDVIGVETGGAIKNPIAVISGIATGLGLGENARAALISRGVREIVMITETLGGNKETAYGLSGVGDLIVTASSMNSRNFKAGLRLGAGDSISEILASSAQVVEGFRTCVSAYEIGKENNLELPLINALYNVLYNGLNVNLAITSLMSRELKAE